LHDLGQPIRIDARVIGVRTAPERKQSGKGGGFARRCRSGGTSAFFSYRLESAIELSGH
jgi:hypothetical protein